MMAKEKPKIKVSFPVSKYFQQLFSSDNYVKLINPLRFWRKYRVTHLDTCWSIKIVQYLERCRKIEWQPVNKQQNPQKIETLFKSGKYRGISWQKTHQNRIFMVQPSCELKYRGVTYRTSNITLPINSNPVEIKPGLIIVDNSEKQSVVDRMNNSETSNNFFQS